MPERFVMAVLRFVASVDRLDEPPNILEALQQIVRIAGVNVLGAWRVPAAARNGDRRSYSVFIHSSMPTEFEPEFWSSYAKNGRSFTAELAWRNERTFTLTEALRLVKPTGADRWIVDLLHRHGVRDVFYVPNGIWMICYWSPKLLRLDAATKAALQLAANAAAVRLERLPGRHRKADADPGLSARQRAVLRLMSQGYTPQQIGDQLEISHGTVKEHIERATRKLGAKSAAHAVAEAIRRYVVIGLGMSAAGGVIFDVYDICCWDEVMRWAV